MTAAALLVALSLNQDLPPPPPPPPVVVVPAPVPGYAAANDREITIKALREEITELADQKSGIGFFFPIFWTAAGVGLILGGTFVQTSESWVKPTLLISGTAIAVLSGFWFIYRIVKSVSLGNQISDKEEQVRRLEGQRPTSFP